VLLPLRVSVLGNSRTRRRTKSFRREDGAYEGSFGHRGETNGVREGRIALGTTFTPRLWYAFTASCPRVTYAARLPLVPLT